MLVKYVSCELWDIKARGGPTTARMQSKALPSPGKATGEKRNERRNLNFMNKYFLFF